MFLKPNVGKLRSCTRTQFTVQVRVLCHCTQFTDKHSFLQNMQMSLVCFGFRATVLSSVLFFKTCKCLRFWNFQSGFKRCCLKCGFSYKHALPYLDNFKSVLDCFRILLLLAISLFLGYVHTIQCGATLESNACESVSLGPGWRPDLGHAQVSFIPFFLQLPFLQKLC
jgi:hypothetical protein